MNFYYFGIFWSIFYAFLVFCIPCIVAEVLVENPIATWCVFDLMVAFDHHISINLVLNWDEEFNVRRMFSTILYEPPLILFRSQCTLELHSRSTVGFQVEAIFKMWTLDPCFQKYIVLLFVSLFDLILYAHMWLLWIFISREWIESLMRSVVYFHAWFFLFFLFIFFVFVYLISCSNTQFGSHRLVVVAIVADEPGPDRACSYASW
jgi:hypothetical protein